MVSTRSLSRSAASAHNWSLSASCSISRACCSSRHRARRSSILRSTLSMGCSLPSTLHAPLHGLAHHGNRCGALHSALYGIALIHERPRSMEFSEVRQWSILGSSLLAREHREGRLTGLLGTAEGAHATASYNDMFGQLG